jgi:hypothetical protein
MLAHQMSPTRRIFLKQSASVAGALALSNVCHGQPEAAAQVILNHVGFLPDSAKFCLVPGNAQTTFTLADVSSGKPLRTGKLLPRAGDLGNFCVGDFSDFQQSGTFEIRADGFGPASFSISADAYLPCVQKSIEYFATQRCGDSKTGHHTPCHLDDGRRQDNGEHRDVTGGWHDACDLRKWVNATIYGMIGLSRVFEILGPQKVNAQRVVDELRWGNQYFLKMQEPDGFLMDYCGGDDGNNYTDTRTGTRDDRVIHTDPCELPAQFNFVAAQAAMIRLTRAADPAYAKSCEEAAVRCLDWCVNKRSPRAATSLSTAVIACVQLHRTTEQERFAELGASFADRLVELQVKQGSVNGFFRAAPDRPEPYREIMNGNLPLTALCEVLEQFPKHAAADRWKQSLRLHVQHLVTISQRSPFGTIPFGLYAEKDPGGNRRIGDYWYRWFMKPNGETRASDWWVGINAHLASNGVGLARASRILSDPSPGQLAQRQLDWILGSNPFNASTVTGVGRNQPALFVTSEFRPATPLIPGGVMNGLGGDANDRVVLDSGSYHTCEYWTPMVAYTMWLMAELMTS